MGAKKGKAGAPSAPTPISSSPKQASKGTGARGSRPFPNGGMSDIQKVLIANGGIGHRLRSKKMETRRPPKVRKSRADKQAA